MCMFSRKFLRNENESLEKEIEKMRVEHYRQGKVIGEQIDMLFKQRDNIEKQNEQIKRQNKQNDYLRKRIGKIKKELEDSKINPLVMRNEMERNVEFRNMRKENDWLQEKLRSKDEKIKEITVQNLDLKSELKKGKESYSVDYIHELVTEIKELTKHKEDKDFVVEKVVATLNHCDYILYMLLAQGRSGHFNSTIEYEIKEIKKVLSTTYFRLMGESK